MSEIFSHFENQQFNIFNSKIHGSYDELNEIMCRRNATHYHQSDLTHRHYMKTLNERNHNHMLQCKGKFTNTHINIV